MCALALLLVLACSVPPASDLADAGAITPELTQSFDAGAYVNQAWPWLVSVLLFLALAAAGTRRSR